MSEQPEGNSQYASVARMTLGICSKCEHADKEHDSDRFCSICYYNMNPIGPCAWYGEKPE